MSFVGLSRKSTASPWSTFVCLDKEDCELLHKAVAALYDRKSKTFLRLKDIHEGGEMTERQEDEMLKAEEAAQRAEGILEDIGDLIKLKEASHEK